MTLTALILAVTSNLTGCDEVRIYPYMFSYVENFTMSREDLKREKGEAYLGLTEAEMYINPGECAVEVGYRNVTVFVATDVQHDACMKEEVYQHEREHVAAYQVAVGTLPGAVRGDHLPYVLRSFFMQAASTQTYIDNKLTAFVATLCDGAFKQFREPPQFGTK